MLRLTLRTLLAYLDDTLEPAQAKDIGKKVAESQFAQETVERIKTVTRRRRLSAPTIDADDTSVDPNMIAEYLDNVLPTNEVADVEQASLNNDVRLAEVAACHQILTLVLGEPAMVPPTARRRMYRVVTGPESIPYRQPTAAGAPVAGVAAPEEVDEFQDSEDDLLGTFLGPRKYLWLIGLMVAVALLCLSIWLAIPPAPPQAHQGYIAVPVPAEPEPRPPANPPKKPDVPGEIKLPPVVPPKADVDPEAGPPPRVAGEGPPPIAAPDSERRGIGAIDSPMQPLLVQKRETIRWERPDPREGRISSADMLLALPGFRPEIQLDTGIRLLLWGNIAEIQPLGLAETRITAYLPPRGLDADFRIHGGRIFISARKAERPTIVRLRFRDEVWDVTLSTPDTEIGIDVVNEPARGPLFDRDLPETARALVYLGVLQGVATVRTGLFQKSGDLLGGAKWKWDSKGGKAGPAPKDDRDEAGIANRWNRAFPETAAGKELAAASTELGRRVGTSLGPFDVEFDATLKDPSEAAGRRVLATWMLAAVSVNNLGYLIDAVESDAAAVRDAAARALQHWVAQDAERETLYAQALDMKVTFTDNQRVLMTSLVRGTERPVASEVVDTLFELLGYDKLAVRELARMQLAKFDPVGARESNYDAGSDRRAVQAMMWKASYKKRMKGKE